MPKKGTSKYPNQISVEVLAEWELPRPCGDGCGGIVNGWYWFNGQKVARKFILGHKVRITPKRICTYCGKEFLNFRSKKSKRFFCSPKCAHEFFKGQNATMFGKHHNQHTRNIIGEKVRKNPGRYWKGKKRPEIYEWLIKPRIGKTWEQYYGEKQAAEMKKEKSIIGKTNLNIKAALQQGNATFVQMLKDNPQVKLKVINDLHAGFDKWIRENPNALSGKGNGMFGKHHKIENIELIRSILIKNAKEHPESLLPGIIALNKWRKDHPDETQQNITNMQFSWFEYLKEHPEHWDTHSKVIKLWFNNHPEQRIIKGEILRKSRAKWQKEHPEEVRAIAAYANDIANKTRVSSIELKLRTQLLLAGMPFKTDTTIKGRPDVFIEAETLGMNLYKGVAIFADGCVTHPCPIHKKRKYKGFNDVERQHYDFMITRILFEQGYYVIRIWEHDIKKKDFNLIEILKSLALFLNG